jgi:hypothetical protein
MPGYDIAAERPDADPRTASTQTTLGSDPASK